MSSADSSIFSRTLDAARAGSREALGATLDRCRTYLLGLARGAIGPALQAKGGASDLVQETFLEAQRDFSRFDGTTGAQFRSWLRSMLLHRAAKLGRRFGRSRKRQISREVPLSVGGVAPPARGSTPSVQLMTREATTEIEQAIERLPGVYREIIVLRYRNELSFDEIGEVLGRSADAARMLWARAVKRLKQDLERDVERN